MNTKRIALGTAAYTLVTFPIAVLWHVIIFNRQYLLFGYFEGEPSFVTGVLAIILQGAVLSGLYPLVRLGGQPIRRGLKYAAIVGAFFWTSHVLAFVAKQEVPNTLLFILMETAYLFIQFGVFGVLIGLIYRDFRHAA